MKWEWQSKGKFILRKYNYVVACIHLPKSNKVNISYKPIEVTGWEKWVTITMNKKNKRFMLRDYLDDYKQLVKSRKK